MPSWTHLVRFTATEDNAVYYTKCDSTLPQVGAKVPYFKSITSLDSYNATSDLKTIKEVSVQTIQWCSSKLLHRYLRRWNQACPLFA
jgi:hypothetical protein